MSLRNDVFVELEGLRQAETIASNQESAVTISTDDSEIISLIDDFGTENFAALCIVSEVIIKNERSDQLIKVAKSTNKKCERCWNFLPSVTDDICTRCAEVIAKL